MPPPTSVIMSNDDQESLSYASEPGIIPTGYRSVRYYYRPLHQGNDRQKLQMQGKRFVIIPPAESADKG